MAEPLLSVIIPTRNRRQLLEEAVRSCLLPLPFSLEVIVSDNASTDATAGIQDVFPQVQYRRRQELLPMAAHWNLCVKEAKGKFIKLLCDDDWILRGGLSRELAMLEAHPEIIAVASARNEVSQDGKRIVRAKGPGRDAVLSSKAIFWRMLFQENVLGPPSAVMFRKDQFQGFPTAYDYAADWAAWILLAEKGSIAFLAEPGCAFRLHEENLTERHVEAGTDFVEVMALRREALRRLPFPQRLVGWMLYRGIFSYRLKRRIVRLLLQKRSPFPFLQRALGETRIPL